SHEAFPELQRFNQELDARSEAMAGIPEATRPWAERFGEWMNSLRPPTDTLLMPATVNSVFRPGKLGEPAGPRDARELILPMSRPQDEGESSTASSLSPNMLGLRSEENQLPARTGQAKDRTGAVIDGFEPSPKSPNTILKIYLPRAKEEDVNPQEEIL